jgi:signal transduction histidine kinase
LASIERGLLAWILGAASAGAMVVAAVAYLASADDVDELFDVHLRHVAVALADHLPAGAPATQAPAGTAPAPPATPSTDPDEEIATQTWSAAGDRIHASHPQLGLPLRTSEGFAHVTAEGDEWVVYTRVTPRGVAQAAQRTSARREFARDAALEALLPALALVVLALGGPLVAALRRGLRPLDRTARDVAARSARSLQPIAAEGVPRELLPLVESINGLMARLGESIVAQQRFLADAAHELRTPVTALKLQLRLLERAGDDAARGEALAELGAAIERTQHLVEQLLLMARYGPEGVAMQPQPVDLSDLAREIAGAAMPLARQRGVELATQGTSPGPVVCADRQQLGVLLDNLVGNALRYTPRGGHVSVHALVHGGQPALVVTDDGPGIPEPERERVFDRFVRGEDAAARAADATGSGLGLSIVRSIAQRHGAVVSLHTGPGGRGLEARVVFPPVR